MTRWMHLGYKAARRVVVAVVGGTVVLIGVAMLALPGPAMVVIPIGLAILGLEFAWARRWLRRLGDVAAEAKARVTGNGNGGTDGSSETRGAAGDTASEAGDPAAEERDPGRC